MDSATIVLILTIVMPRNMPDVVHKISEPSLEQCYLDAKEFTALEKPKIDNAKGVMAACFIKVLPDTPT